MSSHIDAAASLALHALAAVDASAAAIPDAIWVPAASKVRINPLGLFGEASEGHGAVLSVVALKRDDPYIVEGSRTFEIDTSRLPSAAVFSIRDSQASRDRYAKTVSMIVAPEKASGSPMIWCIGDSLTFRSFAAKLKARLEALGMTPNFAGTMRGSLRSSGDFFGELGEAREGKRFADYIYEATNRLSPVATGDESGYLASSEALKQDYNPFLRLATDSDDPSKVFNGYIFDSAIYASRFSVALPTAIFLSLGTSDIFHGADSGDQWLTWIRHGLSVIVPDLLALPSAPKIGIAAHLQSRGSASDKIRKLRHQMYREMISYVRTLNSPRVRFLPWYIHMSQEADFPMTAFGSADPHTGVQRYHVSDPVHFGAINRQICINAAAAWIMSDVQRPGVE